MTAEQRSRIVDLSHQGKSVALVIVEHQVAGAIAMRDEPRPDALAGLKALTDMGIKTVMLTGD
ncbi:HAD family hydrolase, partial [Glaesserella parasuis]